MNYETITYEIEGPLAWITLNRPEKLNAINPQMVTELMSATDRAQINDEVRVIIVKGEGRAFSAGFDLESTCRPDCTREEEIEGLKQKFQQDFEMIMRFWDSPKPTVAAVHTYCLGGGMELAMACDITIAARDCRFGSPEVLYGSGAVALLLPYITGPKIAKEMLLTGNDRIDSELAEKWGLVNRVVKEEKLIDRARETALAIARNDQMAVRISKQAINNTFEISRMRDALKHGLELGIAIETAETEESNEFREILKRDGVKAAIDWRERKLGYIGQVKRHELA
jgi:enoyl-CoA hydratase